MKMIYVNQKPAENFEILDRINMSYLSDSSMMTVQIFPFRIKIDNEIYKFNGLGHGHWTPRNGDVLVAELNSENHFNLTHVPYEFLDKGIDETVRTLGIVAYVGEDQISILRHNSFTTE